MKRFLILTGLVVAVLATSAYAATRLSAVSAVMESVSGNLNQATKQLDVRSNGGNEQMNNSDADFAEKMNSLMPKDKNYVFSPLSLKYALAMAANGADEATKNEITSTLGIDRLDSFNDDVKNYLDEHKLETEENDFFVEPMRAGTSLNIANSVWFNQDYVSGGDFSEEYKALVADKYDATAQNVNNQNAVQKINSWCNEKTNGKIPKIINNSDFISCLVNAVYFNARWSNEFGKGMTHKADFTDRNGNTSQIDFMEQTDHFSYYGDGDIKMLSLPYEGSNISMYIALSNDTRLNFEDYIDKTERKKVHITMPKFKTEFDVDMTPLLSQLGIKKAFDNGSPTQHFASMFNATVNNNINVYISKTVQKAYIAVDEEGTEAAAVTAIMMDATAVMPQPEEIVEFKADTPFTYFIRDNNTDEILFMGEYAFAE
jgi:serpin B